MRASDLFLNFLTFSFVLEKLLRPKLEDIIQLLLGHGAGLGSQTRPHHQMGQHHLPLGYLSDALLNTGSRHKAVDHHLVGLPDAMSSAERLQGNGSLSETQTEPKLGKKFAFKLKRTCMSLWGFQSESKMMTVSAVARFMPKPPARVESKKQNWQAPGAAEC